VAQKGPPLLLEYEMEPEQANAVKAAKAANPTLS
jgi:hypothetical protein